MTQRDYKAYAATEQGRAARAKARAKHNAKRPPSATPFHTAELARIIQNWSRA